MRKDEELSEKHANNKQVKHYFSTGSKRSGSACFNVQDSSFRMEVIVREVIIEFNMRVHSSCIRKVKDGLDRYLNCNDSVENKCC